MTIEEAIEKEKSIAKSNHELANSYHTDFNVYMRQEDACRERAEYHEQVAEWLEELQRLKEQQPCEDAVSRKAVLELINGYGVSIEGNKAYESVCNGLVRATKIALCDAIKKLPSIRLQPKTGHWKRVEQGLFDSVSIRWECSECKKSDRFRSNFCFNCGAKMEEVEE